MKHRLPTYFAEQAVHLTCQDLGIAADDAQGLLLVYAYRLAARLERGLSPWDTSDSRSTELDRVVGGCRVQLRAAVITDAAR